MDISYDLLSQLAKTITPKKERNTESTLNGTVVVDGEGNKYVRPDGSDQLIPVSSTTTNANKGERVTVLIKEHKATVTGNMSSPAARTEDVENLEDQVVEIEKFDILIAGRVETSEAYIKALQADKANIGDLQAAQAQIADLEAEKASIVELNAAKAEITDLNTTKLDATIAEVTYATINSLEVTNAEVKKLEADYGEFKTLTAGKFTANDAVIEELKTGKATIVELEAVQANVTKLDSDLGDFKVLTTNKFTATDASIKELQTDKLSAKDIEGKYANIDFSNISKSTMESFYATSGLIENVVIGDATISGRLVGVVISGDLIEGGTVVAEKLVIQGTDGLYYKLNTDGMKTEAEQTDYNSLNGGILAKKSITASKIDVDDLVAFEATIGGFVIADNSIYSGVKESVDNTTRGIYLDKTGQACFGDATYFLKYYKDQNGDYKLAISADSILIGSDKKNVRTVIGDIEADVEEVRAKAVTAQSTADTAKANAATAQTAANNAQSTADTAKANAVTAQSKADEAKQAADDAQKAADDADEKAAQAQAELVTAQQNLADVTSRVDVTEEEIEAAQAAVVTAQTKADEAATNAAIAQSTADTAKTNAANAQAAANEAKTVADTAKTNADNAQKAADDAQADVDALTTRVNTAETQIEQNTEAINLRATKTEVDERLDGYYSKSQTDALLKIESDKITANVAETNSLGTRMSTVEQTADSLTIRIVNAESDIIDAAKTATNFMSLGDTGLVIGDMTGDELGNNVLIDSDSVDIRSGDVVLASYGASRTSLGKGSKNSTIDMCDESLLIYVSNEDNGYDDAHIYSNKYPITVNGNGYVTTRAEYTDYQYYGSAAINAQSHRPNKLDDIGAAIDSSSIQGKATFYAQTRQKWWDDYGTYIGDTYDTSYVRLIKGSIILCVTKDAFIDTRDGDIIEGEDPEVVPKVSITLSQDFDTIYMLASNGLYINNHKLSAFITYQGNNNGWYYEGSNNNIIKMYRKVTATYRNKNVLGIYVGYPFTLGTIYNATATVSFDGNTAASLDWNAKVSPQTGGYGCNVWVHDASGNFTSTSEVDVYITVIAECYHDESSVG